MTGKKLLNGAVSLLLIFAMASGVILPGAFNPIDTKAATSVYDFDYGDGISLPQGEQLPTFKTPAATKEDPMDALVIANVNKTDEIEYLAASLQGLVNREQPRVMLILQSDEGSYTWPNELIGQGKYKTTYDYKSLLTKYKSVIEGLVVYDPNLPATMNVATSIAGVENCIIASPSNVDALKALLGVEVKVDLRDKFSNLLEAYNYLYDNYYATGKLNKRVLIGLNPSNHKPSIRDFAIATKSAVLWLNPLVAEEAAVMDKFYNEATPGVTYHLGWWTEEDPGVTYGTRKGVSTIPADWFVNMTVYMGQSKEFEIPETPAKPELKNKIYLSFAISDGDNAQYVEHVMKKLWNQRTEESVPISWTCTPAMYYIAPQMLNSYYKTLGKDMLICGPSGFGYTKTTRWREKAGFLDNYIAATDDLFERTGFNIITLWDRISEGTYEAFSSKARSLLGVTINNNYWNDSDPTNPDSMFDGWYKFYPADAQYDYKNDLPIMGLGSNDWGYLNDEYGTWDNDKAYNTLSKLAESFDGSAPVFRFMQIVNWSFTEKRLNALVDKLNKAYPGKFEYVRADHLFMLMNEYNNVPYNVALQKETTALNTDASVATDGSLTTAWTETNGAGKALTVDLGSDYDISRVVLKNAGLISGMNENLNTKAATFQTSLDGANWTTVGTVTGNSDNVIYKDVTSSTARYARVIIDDPGADGVARVQDFEVYGNETAYTLEQVQAAISEAEQVTQGTASDYKWSIFQDAIAATKAGVEAGDIENYTKLVSDIHAAQFGLLPENDIATTAFDLPETLEIQLGDSKTFENVQIPANTTDKIKWTSSDSDIVKVENGTLTALKLGDATITVTTERGLSATMQVSVLKIPVTSITLDKTSLNIQIGKSGTLHATVNPSNATYPDVTMTSSDKSVAEVTASGEIITHKIGTAVITVTSNDDPTITATCTVNVLKIPVTSITLDKTSLTMNVGDIDMIQPTVNPSNASDPTFTMSSSNSSVAEVTMYGEVIAHKAGTAIIKVAANDGSNVYATCTVTVRSSAPTVTTPKNGPKTVKGKVILYKNGKAVTGSTVVAVNGKTYAVVKGYVAIGSKKRVVKIGKRSYIVNKAGVVQKGSKNKLIQISKTKSYIVNKAGIVQKGSKNKLVSVGKKSYIVNKAGVVQKNNRKNMLVSIGKKSYIVNKTGVVQKSVKQIKIGNKIYKTNKQGVATKKK